MIVVDSNVLAYLYLPCEYTQEAEALLEREPDWAAPMLWRSELRNVLLGYVRREQLTLAQATAIQAEAEDLMRGAEYEVDSRRVLELAEKTDCSAYDCELEALALALGTQLVTMDRRVLSGFPDVAVALNTE
ncbi:MAG: type II toxin-antitoxin system VapC family toxin [Actinomycetota bacterium]|nr:type II toxin-antitoxin system VapC family toxin [Actinomycetota bacterium]